MAKKIYHLEVEEGSVKEYYMAIHTLLEAHKLAFYINQKSPVLLSRSKKDIKNEKQEGFFLLFEWQDLFGGKRCQLISNKFSKESQGDFLNINTLFELPERKKVYLIHKFKQVDFFIKSTCPEILKIIKVELSKWSMVSLTYCISSNEIKSQMNLIFD
tara:strand:+ start:223 stop:696 length:474 start_codon:yes stop_codon:yes gene_type:complete